MKNSRTPGIHGCPGVSFLVARVDRNLPICQSTNSASSLPLRLIRVRADDVLSDGDAIFRKAFVIERLIRVLVRLLFVRWTVTFHRSLAFILVGVFRGSWLNAHPKLLYNLPILWNAHSPSSSRMQHRNATRAKFFSASRRQGSRSVP